MYSASSVSDSAFTLIQNFAKDPSKLSVKELAPLEQAVKHQAADAEDGKIRYLYDVVLTMTANLLDAVKLYPRVDPDNGEQKQQKIMSAYQAAQAELTPVAEINFSQLTEEQFIDLLNQRLNIYNRLVLIMDQQNSGSISTINLYNLGQEQKQFEHRIFYDMQLHIDQNFAKKLEQAEIGLEVVNQAFCQQVKSNFSHFMQAIQIPDDVSLAQAEIMQALNQEISYVDKESRTVFSSVGKTVFTDLYYHADASKISVKKEKRYSIIENQDGNEVTIEKEAVTIRRVKIPGRQEFGRRIMLSSQLNEHWKVYQALEIVYYREKNTHELHLVDGFSEADLPTWFIAELSRGEKVYLVGLLNALADYANQVVDGLKQDLDLTSLENVEREHLSEYLLEQVFKELIDAMKRSPSNKGRNMPGRSAIRIDDEFIYERTITQPNQSFESEEFVLVAQTDEKKFFNNASCPAPAKTKFNDAAMASIAKNVLQDFIPRFSAHLKSLSKLGLNRNKHKFYYIPLTVMSALWGEAALNKGGKYWGNNNYTMAKMVKLTLDWLNQKNEEGKLTAFLKELLEDENPQVRAEVESFLDQGAVMMDLALHGVNAPGQQSFLRARFVRDATGARTAMHSLASLMQLFETDYLKNREIGEFEAPLSDIETGLNASHLRASLIPDSQQQDNALTERLCELFQEIRTIYANLPMMHAFQDVSAAEINTLNTKIKSLRAIASQYKDPAVNAIVLRNEAMSQYLHYLTVGGKSILQWFQRKLSALVQPASIKLNLQEVRGALFLLTLPEHEREIWCKSCHDRAQLVKALMYAFMEFHQKHGHFPEPGNQLEIEELAEMSATNLKPAMLSRSCSTQVAAIKSIKGVCSKAELKAHERQNAQRAAENKPKQDISSIKIATSINDAEIVKPEKEGKAISAIRLRFYLDMTALKQELAAKHSGIVAGWESIDADLNNLLDGARLEQWAERINQPSRFNFSSHEPVMNLSLDQLVNYLEKPRALRTSEGETVYRTIIKFIKAENNFDLEQLLNDLSGIQASELRQSMVEKGQIDEGDIDFLRDQDARSSSSTVPALHPQYIGLQLPRNSQRDYQVDVSIYDDESNHKGPGDVESLGKGSLMFDHNQQERPSPVVKNPMQPRRESGDSVDSDFGPATIRVSKLSNSYLIQATIPNSQIDTEITGAIDSKTHTLVKPDNGYEFAAVIAYLEKLRSEEFVKHNSMLRAIPYAVAFCLFAYVARALVHSARHNDPINLAPGSMDVVYDYSNFVSGFFGVLEGLFFSFYAHAISDRDAYNIRANARELLSSLNGVDQGAINQIIDDIQADPMLGLRYSKSVWKKMESVLQQVGGSYQSCYNALTARTDSVANALKLVAVMGNAYFAPTMISNIFELTNDNANYINILRVAMLLGVGRLFYNMYVETKGSYDSWGDVLTTTAHSTRGAAAIKSGPGKDSVLASSEQSIYQPYKDGSSSVLMKPGDENQQQGIGSGVNPQTTQFGRK